MAALGSAVMRPAQLMLLFQKCTSTLCRHGHPFPCMHAFLGQTNAEESFFAQGESHFGNGSKSHFFSNVQLCKARGSDGRLAKQIRPSHYGRSHKSRWKKTGEKLPVYEQHAPGQRQRLPPGLLLLLLLLGLQLLVACGGCRALSPPPITLTAAAAAALCRAAFLRIGQQHGHSHKQRRPPMLRLPALTPAGGAAATAGLPVRPAIAAAATGAACAVVSTQC
eukprot:1159260-Pelagomonas_calceolata.AAC.12